MINIEKGITKNVVKDNNQVTRLIFEPVLTELILEDILDLYNTTKRRILVVTQEVVDDNMRKRISGSDIVLLYCREERYYQLRLICIDHDIKRDIISDLNSNIIPGVNEMYLYDSENN